MIRPFPNGIGHVQIVESTEIQHVSGRLRTLVMNVNMNTVSVVTEEDHHSSIQKLTDDVHIPRISIQRILTKELGMKHVCSTWVLYFLQAKKMRHHHSVCSENLSRISQNRDFLSCVITVNKSWIYYYYPKTKRESKPQLHSGESR